MPHLSHWSTPPSPHMPANTIDLEKLSDHAFSYEQVLARLQKLPPISSGHNIYASRPGSLDPSPTSSITSSSSASSTAASPQETFFSTRSRVVRLYNLPTIAEAFLSTVFLPHNAMEQHSVNGIPVPVSMWELRAGVSNGRRDSVWAVFRSHEEACAALALSGRAMSVATALEGDLEPFHKLHRFILTDPLLSQASNALAPTPTATSMRNNNNTATTPAVFDLPSLTSLPHLRVSSSLSDLQASVSHSPMSAANGKVSSGEYTLSSNPPNPKTSFRLGDWICHSPNCAAHNFGRNLSCIGCGCPRSTNNNGAAGNPSGANMNVNVNGMSQHHHHHHILQQQQQQQQQTQAQTVSSRAAPSPRFNAMANGGNVYYSSGPLPAHTTFQQQQPQVPQAQHREHQQLHHQHSHPHLNVHPTIGQQPRTHNPPSPFGTSSSSSTSSSSAAAAAAAAVAAHAPKSTHPLLTPSGRAFALGGKVQNVSSDPLLPCIMYWPDNEPFPEQGQIRPNGLIGIAQPPILNTGNRGPISHQPGDWICQKCNYLNWRRRKVCQTCLPYAEGNGDSISAAVQAERIALLTSVLSQTQINSGNLNIPSAHASHSASAHAHHAHAPRSHSLTPPQARRPFIDVSPPHPHAQLQPQQQQQQVHHHALNRPVHRSQSHFALGQQFAAHAHAQQAPVSPPFTASSPIYQTSGNRQPSPLYATGPDVVHHRHSISGTASTSANNAVGSRGLMDHRTLTGNVGVGSTISTSTSTSTTVHSTPISVHAPAPAPLLPSFLQDIVQSPALSPTSTTTTSSVDLSSVEEYEDQFPSSTADSNININRRPSMFAPRARGDSGSSAASSSSVGVDSAAIANIWRLDGEESKSLSAFPLPNHQELVGARKPSGEKLRV